MGSAVDLDSPFTSINIRSQKFLTIVDTLLVLFKTAEQRHTDACTNTGFQHSFRSGLGMEVHVGEGGNTALDQLDQAQTGGKQHVPLGKFVFDGEYFSQPSLKGGHIVLVVAHQAHAQVSMGVDQCRHSNRGRSVDDSIGNKRRIVRSCKGNMPAVNTDITTKIKALSRHGNNQGIG